MQEYDTYLKIFKKYFLFYIAKYDNEAVFSHQMFLHTDLINQENSINETLAHLLCYEGMIEKYTPFINLGGKNTITTEGNTVLHYCASSSADNFLFMDLINKGENPLIKNNNGQTCIHMIHSVQLASYFTNWNLITFSNIQRLTDNEGNTIAHSAALNKQKEILDYFLSEYPMLKNQKNNLGLTPLQIYKLLTVDLADECLNKEFLSLFAETNFKFSMFYENINEKINQYILPEFQGKIEIDLLNKVGNYPNIKSSKLVVNGNQMKIFRENLTNFEKLKPMSIPSFKKEAQLRFKEAEIIPDPNVVIYKEIIATRDKEHDFHFNSYTSKK